MLPECGRSETWMTPCSSRPETSTSKWLGISFGKALDLDLTHNVLENAAL